MPGPIDAALSRPLSGTEVSERIGGPVYRYKELGSMAMRIGDRMWRYAVKNPRGDRATALTPASSILGSIASTSSMDIHGYMPY